jgi:hypothetical protein
MSKLIACSLLNASRGPTSQCSEIYRPKEMHKGMTQVRDSHNYRATEELFHLLNVEMPTADQAL